VMPEVINLLLDSLHRRRDTGERRPWITNNIAHDRPRRDHGDQRAARVCIIGPGDCGIPTGIALVARHHPYLTPLRMRGGAGVSSTIVSSSRHWGGGASLSHVATINDNVLLSSPALRSGRGRRRCH